MVEGHLNLLHGDYDEYFINSPDIKIIKTVDKYT